MRPLSYSGDRPLMSAAPLLAAVIWAIALIVDSGPFAPTSVLLIGIGLLGMATASVVGIVVAGGRWARRLGLVVVGATSVLALVRPIDAFWILGLGATALAGAALFLPSVLKGIRKLPAATGPPQRAVLVPLVLIGAPYILGIASNDAAPWATLTVGIAAPVAAFAYSRVLPGGLLAVRVLWPVLAITLAIPMGSWGGFTSAALGGLIAALAWDGSVRTAFHPPKEAGSAYPIPSELAPKEILDETGIDDRGRRN